MSTKSQESKDRCEEQNEELRELKVGLKCEEEMLGNSKEMMLASSKEMMLGNSKEMLASSKEMIRASRSLRGSNQLLQIPDASPSR